MKLVILLIAALVLAGCASTPGDDRYQFGDGSKALLGYQRDYCATTSPLLRAGLLIAIRSQVPDYPPSGLCTDAEKALAAEIARQVAGLPEGAVVSVEQARKDQRRFSSEQD